MPMRAMRSGPRVVPPEARMTSGARATNSAAYLRMRSGSPAPQRMSMRTLRPSVQPLAPAPVHGGRRAKPLFSIVWYSLQTVQELYCYAIGLCFVADLLDSRDKGALINTHPPADANEFPQLSRGAD